MHRTYLKGISGHGKGTWRCPHLLENTQHRVTHDSSQHSSEGKRGSRASSQEEVPCHALQEYPINNMVTGNVQLG